MITNYDHFPRQFKPCAKNRSYPITGRTTAVQKPAGKAILGAHKPVTLKTELVEFRVTEFVCYSRTCYTKSFQSESWSSSSLSEVDGCGSRSSCYSGYSEPFSVYSLQRSGSEIDSTASSHEGECENVHWCT